MIETKQTQLFVLFQLRIMDRIPNNFQILFADQIIRPSLSLKRPTSRLSKFTFKVTYVQ